MLYLMQLRVNKYSEIDLFYQSQGSIILGNYSWLQIFGFSCPSWKVLGTLDPSGKEKYEYVRSCIMAKGKESVYWMESELERKRLASNHFIAKDATGGKLVLAPVDFSKPMRILDSGTADGAYTPRLHFLSS